MSGKQGAVYFCLRITRINSINARSIVVLSMSSPRFLFVIKNTTCHSARSKRTACTRKYLQFFTINAIIKIEKRSPADGSSSCWLVILWNKPPSLGTLWAVYFCLRITRINSINARSIVVLSMSSPRFRFIINKIYNMPVSEVKTNRLPVWWPALIIACTFILDKTFRVRAMARGSPP